MKDVRKSFGNVCVNPVKKKLLPKYKNGEVDAKKHYENIDALINHADLCSAQKILVDKVL